MFFNLFSLMMMLRARNTNEGEQKWKLEIRSSFFVNGVALLRKICEIQGKIGRAIKMYQKMITITKEDWTVEGEGIDYIMREIARLEKMR